MISRREMLFGVGACLATSYGLPAYAHAEKFKLDEKYEPQLISFSGYNPGTIIIDPKNHFLYLQLAAGKARRYGVGVGRAGLAFKGQAKVGRKANRPTFVASDPRSVRPLCRPSFPLFHVRPR